MAFKSAGSNIITDNDMTLTWYAESWNPLDSTTYWLATTLNTAPSIATNGNRRHQIPVTTSDFTLNVGIAANGSTEAVTWTIRNHTQSTEANFSPTHSWTASGQANAWYGTATLSCDAGDFIEIKCTTPAWATNPTTTRLVTLLHF